jgi:hypothetical protein
MRKLLVIGTIAACAALAVAPMYADEGMWMLHQLGELDQAKLKAMGITLTPTELWDLKTNTGLASAIPSLGGCSASFVSAEGLIVTNHHCAFGAIQQNSTPEKDYITKGFLAKTKAEELPARGSRVYVFKGYEDITTAVRSALKPSMKPEERGKALETREKELVAACEKDGLRCRVASMYNGYKYYMFKQQELRDVRLVYAPPRSIGEYGGETDNWMWPRHTGDWSYLRAYVGADGKPADFNAANVPFKPERFLKVATVPVKEGDFTMIMGYPGRTMRYRLAASLQDDLEFNYPQRVKTSKETVAILEEHGRTGKDVEIKLASRVKGIYNGLKKSEGMLEGLTKSDLIETKRAEEAKLAAWIAADPARKAKYGAAIATLERLQAERRATRERDMVFGSIGQSSSLLGAASTAVRWAEERAKPSDLDREMGFQARDERQLRQRFSLTQRNLDLPTDKDLFAYALRRAAALPAGQRIAPVDAALAGTGKTGDDAIKALIEKLYGTTTLADEKSRTAMLDEDLATLQARKDPFVDLALALRKESKKIEEADKRSEGEAIVANPLYMEALLAARGGALYPDANGTLRFTYATVKGYSPRDGVYNKPFTTLAGVAAKHTGKGEFNCPPSLLEAAKKGPYERYTDPRLGDVPSCFLSTNDITGGNSGSPIMNGKGELIGLAFDGNYEWLTSDYEFSDDLSRTINVSSIYMLWVMDHLDKAHNLLREMGIEPLAK